MSQIVYTELEALPIRWPYLQLEPLDVLTTKTWTSDQTFNTSTTSATYTTTDVSSPTEVALYGSLKLGQVWKRQATNVEWWDNLEVSIRKIGSPGPLRVEFYTAQRSNTDFLSDIFRELDYNTFSTSDTISTTTWRADTRNFPNKVRVYSIHPAGPSTYSFQIRTAQTNGSPGSTILASATNVSGRYVFPSPITLDPGLYSFIFYTPSGTANLNYDAPRTYVDYDHFGYNHSTWVSIDSGSTWSSAGRTNYGHGLEIFTPAYVLNEKLGEYEISASQIGTTTTYTSILPSDRKIVHPDASYLYVVFSSPQSPNTSNCYMIQRGGTYEYRSGWVGGGTYYVIKPDEHFAYFDGSTWTYRPHDLLIRKTYLQYAYVADTFSNTYFLGPGSYSPKLTIQLKAASGTVYARPVIQSGIFINPTEKSTTSTTYTTLTWDLSGSVPEIRNSQVGPIRFLVRGNGAYNQVSYEPRIYYDKNPVTPRDFGFTELYLMRIRADAANSLARFNDKTNIFFASAGDSVVIDPNFRAPVSKIQVVTGRVTCDLLGVM